MKEDRFGSGLIQRLETVTERLLRFTDTIESFAERFANKEMTEFSYDVLRTDLKDYSGILKEMTQDYKCLLKKVIALETRQGAMWGFMGVIVAALAAAVIKVFAF